MSTRISWQSNGHPHHADCDDETAAEEVARGLKAIGYGISVVWTADDEEGTAA